MPAACDNAGCTLTIQDVVEVYLRHAAAEGIHCPESRADRLYTLGLFAAQLGQLRVTDARPFHLTDFVDAHAGWRSVATRRKVAGAVRAAFQWAADGERIARNPFARVRYAEAERRPELPDATLTMIQRLANKPYELALRWLRLTGCRLSEMCEATWADVDLERGIWTIPRHKSRKITGKTKIVALVGQAVRLLRGMAPAAAETRAAGNAVPSDAAETAPAGTIFLNGRGTPWNRRSLGQQLRRMKRRYGITTPATLHGVRHRFAGQAVANGAPLALISAQLGHATVAVTQRYYVDLSGQIEAIRAAAELGVRK